MGAPTISAIEHVKDFQMELWFAAVGFFAAGVGGGLLTSVLGVGGSLIVIPALLVLLPCIDVPASVTPAMALGTSLTASLFTAAFAAHAHWRRGNLPQPFGRGNRALMASIGTGAVAGSMLATSVPFSVALGAIAVLQVLAGAMLSRPQRRAPAATDVPFDACAARNRLYFAFVGFLTSIGAGGTLIVPWLLHQRVEHQRAVALAGWLGGLIGASALVVYGASTTPVRVAYAVGDVNLLAVLCLATGSLIATRAGARWVGRFDSALLRRILVGVLLASSLRILLKLI